MAMTSFHRLIGGPAAHARQVLGGLRDIDLNVSRAVNAQFPSRLGAEGSNLATRHADLMKGGPAPGAIVDGERAVAILDEAHPLLVRAIGKERADAYHELELNRFVMMDDAAKAFQANPTPRTAKQALEATMMGPLNDQGTGRAIEPYARALGAAESRRQVASVAAVVVPTVAIGGFAAVHGVKSLFDGSSDGAGGDTRTEARENSGSQTATAADGAAKGTKETKAAKGTKAAKDTKDTKRARHEGDAKASGSKDPSSPFGGLFEPEPTKRVTTKEGDTLARLSKRYGVSEARLVGRNFLQLGMLRDGPVPAGTEIKVPPKDD